MRFMLPLACGLAVVCAAEEPTTPPAPQPNPSASKDILASDTIYLTNGHRLSGTIEESPEGNQGIVTLRTGHGYMTIPAENIARIEHSLESASALPTQNDYAGIMALVQRAILEKRKQEAITLLEQAIILPGADSEGVRLLGALLDDQGGQGSRVRDLYRLYRDTYQGTEPKTLERLAELEGMYNQYEIALARIQQETKEIKNIEGIEARPGWSNSSTNHFNPSELEIIRDETLPNFENKVLNLKFNPGKNYKTSTFRRINVDATGQRAIRLSVRNPSGSVVELSLALKTGDEWKYYETPTQKIPADNAWHTLNFDLQAVNFKTAATNWNHSSPLENAADTRELHLQIHNGGRSGNIFIDALAFIPL